jgi:hypothetical protein
MILRRHFIPTRSSWRIRRWRRGISARCACRVRWVSGLLVVSEGALRITGCCAVRGKFIAHAANDGPCKAKCGSTSMKLPCEVRRDANL